MVPASEIPPLVPPNSSGLLAAEKANIIVDLQPSPVVTVTNPMVVSTPVLAPSTDPPKQPDLQPTDNIIIPTSSSALVISYPVLAPTSQILPIDTRLPLLPFRDDALLGVGGSLLFDKPDPESANELDHTSLSDSESPDKDCLPPRAVLMTNFHNFLQHWKGLYPSKQHRPRKDYFSTPKTMCTRSQTRFQISYS